MMEMTTMMMDEMLTLLPQRQDDISEETPRTGISSGKDRNSPAESGKIEEIVISGMSGRFPSSNNIQEFKDQLFAGVDLVTEGDTRWPPGIYGLPKRMGVIKDLESFDASFFGVNAKQAESMDPQQRLLLEVTYEAIVDAGFNPMELRGSRTGVYIGVTSSDTEHYFIQDPHRVDPYCLMGCCRAMLPNRVSYSFNFTGPSYAVDTACSSSLTACHLAFTAINKGECDAAIVAGVNILLKPEVSLQFHRLGMLSPDGYCKAFDACADGYARSEAVVAIFLQKASIARRVYATIVNTKLNTDGFKVDGITYPNGEMQKKLINEVYDEVGVDPRDISYVETHGTGTKAGDPQELNTIAGAFCKDRPSPLLIGSVKSNMGHAEAASGLCSMVKMLISMEAGQIPGNLHLHTPNDIPALLSGQLQVVDKNWPWNGGLVGINCFGFGGANAHVILRSNPVNKVPPSISDIPILILVSGRNDTTVENILNRFENLPTDDEQIALFRKIYQSRVAGHHSRGCLLKDSSGSVTKEVSGISDWKRPIWFAFSGMGSQYAGVGNDMLRLPIFARSIKKCADALATEGWDLYKTLTDENVDFTNVIDCFVMVAAVQIALVDVLHSLCIHPDGIVGHSLGEVGCAYADGAFTAEQAIRAAFWRGECVRGLKTPHAAMAAVGLSWEEAKKRCPKQIDISCNNSADNVTLSGPIEVLTEFCEQLKTEGIFTRLVNTSGIAFHSRYIADAGPKLRAGLNKFIKSPKLRTSRWISSCFPKEEWESEICKYSSVDYHVKNFLSPVLFKTALEHIPENAVVIEVAPHGLMQAILRRALNPTHTVTSLMRKDTKNKLTGMFSAIGKIYNAGVDLQLSALYPSTTFPVSRGTAMIGPLVEWDRSQQWRVAYFKSDEQSAYESVLEVDLESEEYEYLAGHCIDGRILFPAAGYLILVWRTLYKFNNESFTELPVIFENVKFERATIVQKEGKSRFSIAILTSTGEFVVSEGGSVTVTGIVRSPDDVSKEMLNFNIPESTRDNILLDKSDIYKDLRLRGYDYTGIFRGVQSFDLSANTCTLDWNDNYIAFIDTLLQSIILGNASRGLLHPTGLKRAVIDPKKHKEIVSKLGPNEGVKAVVDIPINLVSTGGIEIRGMKASLAPRKAVSDAPKLERYVWIPYNNLKESSKYSALTICLQLVLENSKQSHNIKCVELLEAGTPDDKILAVSIAGIMESEPSVMVEMKVVGQDIASAITLQAHGVEVLSENPDTVNGDKSNLLVVGQLVYLPKMLNWVAPSGFILVEDPAYCVTKVYSGLNVISAQKSESSTYVLLKKFTEIYPLKNIVHISEENYRWVEDLKSAAAAAVSRGEKFLLLAEGEKPNGIVGLMNCLRLEPGGEHARMLWVKDENAQRYSSDVPIYANQLEKDLIMNVFNNGHFGSFRHLPIENSEEPSVKKRYAYINTLARGDLSSLRWIEGPPLRAKPSEELCYIFYAALNFRDIMIATGRLPPDALPRRLATKECVLGFEFSGFSSDGRRVMGVVSAQGLATAVLADPMWLWDVPDNWTLKEAATIPVVYSTAYYALIVRGRMKKGDSLLVHAGSGGVGQAAITIALDMGVEVFTTVGSNEKREFLIKQFPALQEANIGSTRDTSFEQLVLRRTNGRGVDLVLNSLAEDKLQASIQCLAENGRFLEIGKFDLANNANLGMAMFLKNTTFHGVLIDVLFGGTEEVVHEIFKLVRDGIASGVVRPLPVTVLSENQVEDAFRFMATGRHIGKVVLQIRDEDGTPNKELNSHTVRAIPRTYMDPETSYILVGGLGGFGLELAQWLATRGARKIVLTSRSGIKTGYQALAIKRLRDSGVEVLISTENIATLASTEQLLVEATKLGVVGGIFNLATVLQDKLLENLVENDYVTVSLPKMVGTRHLDIASRKLCPSIKYFVVFSSMSCGRGNAGQTNYGWANSVMERICEDRLAAGLPGLAIQWGAIGDVGLVAEMFGDKNIIVGGTVPQRMVSCLKTMDFFLQQSYPIVSSVVLATKRKYIDVDAETSILKAVARILGLKSIDNVNKNSTLIDLGMDSLMAAEIKQVLERKLNVTLSSSAIRQLSFENFQTMSDGSNLSASSLQLKNEVKNVPSINLNMNVKMVPPLTTFSCGTLMPAEAVARMSSIASTPEHILFMVHPLVGNIRSLSKIAAQLPMTVYGLYSSKDVPADSIPQMAKYYAKRIREIKKEGPYNIMGYSYGAAIAFEIAIYLERDADVVNLICLDGSPFYITALTGFYTTYKDVDYTLRDVDAMILFALLVKNVDEQQMRAELLPFSDYEAILKATGAILADISNEEDICAAADTFYNRLKVGHSYIPTEKFHGQITLIKAKDNYVQLQSDYGLSEVCTRPINLYEVAGDHLEILEGDNIETMVKIIGSTF